MKAWLVTQTTRRTCAIDWYLIWQVARRAPSTRPDTHVQGEIMSTSIDNLLTQYDTGKLSRRNLLAAIALIAAPKPARA